MEASVFFLADLLWYGYFVDAFALLFGFDHFYFYFFIEYYGPVCEDELHCRHYRLYKSRCCVCISRLPRLPSLSSVFPLLDFGSLWGWAKRGGSDSQYPDHHHYAQRTRQSFYPRTLGFFRCFLEIVCCVDAYCESERGLLLTRMQMAGQQQRCDLKTWQGDGCFSNGRLLIQFFIFFNRKMCDLWSGFSHTYFGYF